MSRFGVTEKKERELWERMQALGIRESDLEEEFIRSSGAGGQNVNRVATCVRLKHKPTGLEVKTQKSRSQSLNRFFARRRLCELLEAQQKGVHGTIHVKTVRAHKQKDRRRRRAQKKYGRTEANTESEGTP